MVWAPNYQMACQAFRAVHPDRIPNVLNCASVYSASEFEKSKMSDIKVDVSSITPEAQYQLAKGCLEFYFSIVSQPGGREQLDAWKAEHLRKESRT